MNLRPRRDARKPGYVFAVAQIFNLPYHRFVIGRAPITPRTLNSAGVPQVTNLRYSAARRRRNQRSAAVSAGPAAAGRHHTKRWSKTGTSGGSDALRLVLRTQPRSAKSSRPATIWTDTDRVQ